MKITPRCPECGGKLENMLVTLLGIDNVTFSAWVCPKGDLYQIARKAFEKKWHKRQQKPPFFVFEGNKNPLYNMGAPKKKVK